MALRAYPAIFALAACNQVFGLDDPVGFVDAPVDPPDAGPKTLGTCLDAFDTVHWRVIDPTGFPITVGDELSLDVMGPIDVVNGIETTERWDLRAGRIDVRVADPVDVLGIETTIAVLTEDGGSGFVLTRTRNQLTFKSFLPGFESGSTEPLTVGADPLWRIRHAPEIGIVAETGVDGISWTPRVVANTVPGLDSVSISITAQVTAGLPTDRIAFDDFLLVALCK